MNLKYLEAKINLIKEKLGKDIDGLENQIAELVDQIIKLSRQKPLRGKDGDDGEDGEDGYTPIKGKDYFTQEDIDEIVSKIKLPATKIERKVTQETIVKEVKKELTQDDLQMITEVVLGSLEIDPAYIRDSLETLEGDNRLDASAIKNLPETTQIFSGGGVSGEFVNGNYLRLDGNNSPMTGNVDWGNFDINSLGSVQFDINRANGSVEGRLEWNANNGFLEIGMPGGNVNLQIGEEELVRVRNNSGVTIPNGSAVYITGESGNKPTVALAMADTVAGARAIGVATEEIAHNSNGYVTTRGKVNEIDTSGYTEGQEIYLSASVLGGFTGTMPTSPNIYVHLGHVIKVSATQGSIYVDIYHAFRMDDLTDVGISSVSDNQFLRYDAVSGLWKNETVAFSDNTLLTYIDQSGGTSDTYGVLSGALDGVNTTYTVSQAEYRTGTLEVYLNGQLQTQGTGEDWTETTPASGTFDFVTAPQSTDEITVKYQVGTPTELLENIVLTKTADYTITGNEATAEISVNVDATAGNITITLPTAVSYQNRFLNICKIDTSVNKVTIDGNGSETINGDLTKTISSQYTSIRMQSDGSNYFIR